MLRSRILLVAGVLVASALLAQVTPPAATPPATPIIPEFSARSPDAVTMLFAGDIHFQWGVATLIQEHGPAAPVKDIAPLFAESDFRVANVETAISDEGTPYPGRSHVFGAPARSIETLKALKLNLAVLANNHIMDLSTDGLNGTIKNLKTANILYVGAGANAREAAAPALFNIGGMRFAILAASAIGDEGMWSDEKRAGSARPAQMIAAVAALRGRVDHIIVNMHWGVEYNPYADLDQQAFARQLVSAGAAAVIGHHPHVPQGIEVDRGSIICYSLGNFLFGSSNPYQRPNLLVQLKFEPKKVGVQSVRIIPIQGEYRTYGHAVKLLSPRETQGFWPELYAQSRRINPGMRDRFQFQPDGTALIKVN
ncbi:MAG: CapA family protein [Spirochaetia bacterium]|nr:CapA family protein [Spirochaetia bacterium]